MRVFSRDRPPVWLVVYLIGSIPVLMFYAAGLAGWFFDYPIPLFITILGLLAIPLVLIRYAVRSCLTRCRFFWES